MLFRKNKKDSLSDNRSSYTPENSEKLSGKASARASFKTGIVRGSFTVECAFILTAFFLCMTVMISFMEVYQLQTEKLTHLCQTAKETGMYISVSSDAPEEITIPDVYNYTPAVNGLGIRRVVLHNSVKVHTWTGKRETEKADTNEEIVYITEISGSVNHKKVECSYLTLSVEEVSKSSLDTRRNQYGCRYYPCEKCHGGSGRVFITKTGTRYHKDRNCSGLKRSVKAVKISSVDGWRACSRCGG